MYLSQVSDAKEVIRVSYCDVTDNTHVLLLKKLGDPAEFRSAFRVFYFIFSVSDLIIISYNAVLQIENSVAYVI